MVKNIITILGILFVLTGIWGFFQNPILGIFAVDPLHNVVHLISGTLAIIFSLTSESAARTFAKVFGFFYGLVAVVGLFSTNNQIFGIMANNAADTFLHFLFAIVFLALGYAPQHIPTGRPAGAAR